MCAEFPVSREIRADYAVELDTLQAHHIIKQEHLKGLARRLHLDLDLVLCDSRNGMSLCEYHHTRHTNHRQRVPRILLPEGVYDFAAELHIEWLLDREYPQ